MKKAPGRTTSAKKAAAKSVAKTVKRQPAAPVKKVAPPKKVTAAKKVAVAGKGAVVAKSVPRQRPLAKPTAPSGAPRPRIAPPKPHAKANRAPSERPRRMIFVDVENTSSEERLLSALEHLKIDRRAAATDLVAIGNWKAVGARTARLLARAGAQLMHSAPATGVRDWSDLWIAVAAGRWIAHARPGDRLDIISDDQAFDAVMDAAAASGIDFHRLSYRTLTGLPIEPAPASEERERPRRRRRGGRGRKSLGHVASPSGMAEPHAQSSAPPPGGSATPRPHASAAGHAHAPASTSPGRGGATVGDSGPAASPEVIRETLRQLTRGDTERWVNLDLLGNALRAQGFGRPPGSARLVTRVRLLHDVEVSPTGMVRFKPEGAAPVEPAAALVPEATDAPAAKAARPRRRSPRRKTDTPTTAT